MLKFFDGNTGKLLGEARHTEAGWVVDKTVLSHVQFTFDARLDMDGNPLSLKSSKEAVEAVLPDFFSNPSLICGVYPDDGKPPVQSGDYHPRHGKSKGTK